MTRTHVLQEVRTMRFEEPPPASQFDAIRLAPRPPAFVICACTEERQKYSASGMLSLRWAMNACNASSMAGSRPGSS